jgi:parallel beta-helix repeat protein
MSGLSRVAVAAATGALLVVSSLALTATSANAGQHRALFVAPRAQSHASGHGCGSATYRSIGAAVAAAHRDDTVVVCRGTYREGVAVSKPVRILAAGRVTVDASGHDNGFRVTASGVTIRGFTVRSAIGEGILVLNAKYVTIDRDVVRDNDQGGQLTPVPNTYPQCQAQGGIPGDCGEGIHLWSSSYSTVSHNVSTGNTGGILVTDETGPASHNRITGNVVTDNALDCGVTVVGHNPAAAPNGRPAPKAAGVFGNLVAGNVIVRNGLVGHGGGVILATPFPGGAVYDNVIEGNLISRNGLAGVTVHSHAPGQYLNGNVVRHNTIGTNNLTGDSDFPVADPHTTGVLVGTAAPLRITVEHNVISDNHFGIWTTGPATVRGEHRNVFRHVAVPVSHN